MNGFRVVLHSQMSLDSKATGFDIDMGTHYQLAETFEPDGIISGADTFLAAPIPDEVPEWSFEVAKNFPSCSRSVMAIVDSKGRVRNWSAIKKQPFWKTPVALCSRSTPKEYLQYLEAEGIDAIIAGKDKVDLKKALKDLRSRYGLRTLRIDSGGTLSAIMLKEGLIDEISVILSPCIVGNSNSAHFINPAMSELPQPCHLKLKHLQELENGQIWLKYDVIKVRKKK
ncbi:MAG: dihydrofolate reductase family protein [Methanomassiliicoccales archaeon]